MKIATLFHNPQAGTEDHSKDEIISLLKDSNIECRYSSTKKKGWREEEIDPESDMVIIAGGDGTIRNVIKQLIKRPLHDKQFPIGLLPLGTANNISKTLGVTTDLPAMIKAWKNATKKKFDVGRLYNVEAEQFFIESFGYGIFPYLMLEMKKNGSEELEGEPEKKLALALKTMRDIVMSYPPKDCRLIIDGKDYSGKYLLAEVMNTRSIGPNINLAPLSDPGDGDFEVVLVREDDKDKFASYIESLQTGSEEQYKFDTIIGQKISITWDGTHVHVDDEAVKVGKNTEVKIEILGGVLKFLVP